METLAKRAKVVLWSGPSAHISPKTGFASGQVCIANAEKQPEIDMADARPQRKTADAKYIPSVLRRASFALPRLASGSGVGSRFKMAAVERRRCGLAIIMMLEAGYFDLEDDATAPKKKKRSMWVKPFLLRRNDPTCDTMLTIQCEFLEVSTNAKSRLLAFLRRK